MARPTKKGLDYFNLDCVQDDTIQYIEAKHGLIAFAVLVKIWSKIYQFEGYYAKWNDKVKFLWAKEFGIDPELLCEILETCFEEGIFHRGLMEKEGILTSRGIQKRYELICKSAKRKGSEIDEKYSVLEFIPEETPVSSEETPKKPQLTPEESTQRKEKKKKEKEREEKEIFEQIISHLNQKAGTSYRPTTAATQKAIRGRIADGFSLNDFLTVIDKKCREWKGTEMEKHLNPDTLFRPSNFEKYLNQKIIRQRDQNEIPIAKLKGRPKYDFRK